MFKSSSMREHLVRGCIGFALLGLTIYLVTLESFWAASLGIILAIIGFFVLRGCPACWIIGLITTISSSGKTCTSCERKNESTSIE